MLEESGEMTFRRSGRRVGSKTGIALQILDYKLDDFLSMTGLPEWYQTKYIVSFHFYSIALLGRRNTGGGYLIKMLFVLSSAKFRLNIACKPG